VWNGYGWNLKPTDAPSDGKIYGRRNATWAETLADALSDGKVYGRKNAAWFEIVSDVTKAYVDAEVAKQVAATGDTMSGALIVTPKGSTFGNASGTAATAGVANTDANILIYNYSGVNWCGMGTDSNGTFWLRTGGSGSPVPAFRIHADQVSHFTGPLNAVGVTALGRGFSPSNVDAASFLAASASYGGGLTLIDGAYRATIYAAAANMVLATGGNPPAAKLTLQNDNNHQLTGSLNAAGIIKSTRVGENFRQRGNYRSVIHYNDDSTYHYLITNYGDPDGGWNSLRPIYFDLGNGNVTMAHAVNYGTLSGGTINASTITGTWLQIDGGPSDPIRITTGSGAHARYWSTVAGVRSWSFGCVNWGDFYLADESAGAMRFQIGTGGHVTIAQSCSVGTTLSCGSTFTCSANAWVNGGVLYLSGGGHYIAWQDGWFYDFPHGPIRLQGAWVVREGTAPTMSGIISSGNVHSHGGHYYMNSDNGVWQRWRGDLGRSEFSHGIYVSTVHQHAGSYAAGYYQKGGVSGGFEGARFNIQNGGPAFHFWSEDTSYGAIYMGSDYRIKKDVKPLSSTWEKVKTLRPISFKLNGYGGFTEDGVERWGFIAHELQDALIESVANGKKDVVNEIQAPWPMAVIAPITKALQEAMERIEQLEDVIYLHFKKEK